MPHVDVPASHTEIERVRPEDQAEVTAFLESGNAFGSSEPCKRIDTHAASVFLTGDRAWKLKRAVRYPYLDFTTPELRRATLGAELRLNRRTAPDLYLAVHPIMRGAAGLAIDGEGEVVDWVLEMRRFPDGALLDELARQGTLDPSLMLALADRVSAFHSDAEQVVRPDGAARFGKVLEGNARSFRPFAALFGTDRIEALLHAHRQACERHAPLLDARGRKGRIRHVHGDLHLANIALVEGMPTPFDCLEFDAELATTDTLYDLAFLLMDLWHRNLRTAANLVFNRYVDLTADEEGVPLLPLFLSVRAAIRAHVLAATSEWTHGEQAAGQAHEFFDLAERLMRPVPARLVAIGGLSGSGKSAVAREVGGAIGAAPGARILRSDVLRKRLAGVPPEEKLPASLYTPLANRTVYDLLGDCAARHLSHGTCVIVDAVAAHADERAMMAKAAARAHAPFTGIWLEAPEDVRLTRVCARTADASDADAAVVVAQSGYKSTPPGEWHRVAAEVSLEGVAGAVRSLIDPGGAGESGR